MKVAYYIKGNSVCKRLAIVAIMMSLTLEPCFSQARAVESSTTAKPRYGGTLIIGDCNQPALINPVLTDHGVSVSIYSLVSNRLMRISSHGEFEPDLATSWGISPDGLVYTFNLRKNLKFHDGVKFTSQDILYTYRMIQDPKVKSPYLSTMNNVQEISTPNSYTFVVTLKKPQPSFISEMTREIIPKHLYEGTDIYQNIFNYQPVGTGPFRFKEWKHNGQIVLEANMDYFAGRPYLDRIVFTSYPNRSEVWSAFMRGEVDLIRFISTRDYELTKNDPSFKTYALPTSDYYVISYNLRDPVLADPKVRKAIAHAIDTPQLIQKVEKGYGIKSTGPFLPGSWAFNPNVQLFAYDPAESVKLLNEAGWIDINKDGMLEKNKNPLVIRMMIDGRDEKMRQMALWIRQYLQEVGIRLETRLYRSDAEMRQLADSGDCQAHLTFFLTGGFMFDPNDMMKFWFSNDYRKGNIWGNNYLNPEIDQLIKLDLITQDKEKQKEIYQSLHKILYDEQLVCFLYFPYAFHAVSQRIKGIDVYFNSLYMPEYMMKDFYIQNADILKKRGGDQ